MKQGYIYIYNNIFNSLFALSHEEQEKGLMNQSWPPPVMSFVYQRPAINKFWMKNTPSPLDIVFSNNGKITQICKGEPHSTSIIGDNEFSDLVIELPYGTVKSSGIKLGHEIGLVSPSLEDLKLIINKKI